jgi:small nuclear ribonucleoprotein (snRNP)-like protein
MADIIPMISFATVEGAAKFIDYNLNYEDVAVTTPDGKTVAGTLTSFDSETMEATLTTREHDDGSEDEEVVKVARIKVF